MNLRCISPRTRYLHLPRPFRLESGDLLADVTVAFRTWGARSCKGGAILVCHPLTGSADADAWWPALFSPGRTLDPAEHFIVCSNVLGSCYGTTGPASPGPDGRTAWGPDFPPVTIRDMVRLQRELLATLGTHELRLVIGGSLGGMQALEWAASFPDAVDRVVVIAAPGRHSAWATALSVAQRAAIRADGRFRDGRYPAWDPPRGGLAAARMVAMCTYRSPSGLAARFRREASADGSFPVERYLRHHGDKLVARFDANCYVTLTRAMDSHDVSRGRGSYREALRAVRTPVLVVGIESDVLYPLAELRELAHEMPLGRFAVLASPHGHDAFLIEAEAVDALTHEFLKGPSARPRAAGGVRCA